MSKVKMGAMNRSTKSKGGKVRAKTPEPATDSPYAGERVGPLKDRQHISIRQIKNGHIVNHSGVKNGKHYDEEMYTPHAPKLDMKAAGAREKRLEGKKL